jgi:hypothetical protein
MPTVRFGLHVEGGEKYKALSRDLRAQGRGDLQRRLRAGIKDAGKPAVADVRASARAVQVTSSKGGHARPDTSTHLRERVAKATTIAVRQKGIRIKVSAKKVGPYGVVLPKYLDASLGRYQRWRHPVFGNRSNWVEQKGQPYFGVTIKRHAQDFRRALLDVMDDVGRELTG